MKDAGGIELLLTDTGVVLFSLLTPSGLVPFLEFPTWENFVIFAEAVEQFHQTGKKARLEHHVPDIFLQAFEQEGRLLI